jgi:outer membrane protein OmpA-like peptidoglycan-associated protein
VVAAAVGFAGYVFLVPYQRVMSALGQKGSELAEARAATEAATAERDKLKAEVTRLEATAKDKDAADAKKRGGADALGSQLKSSLEELGAAVSVDAGRVALSFPADKIIDSNGIDVSASGQTTLKVLAGVLKKSGGSAHVKAQLNGVAPPKDLRTLFRTAGEMSAVRAARVMSVLHDSGVAPDHLSTFGEAEKAPPRPPARGKKAPPPAPAPDRVDIQVDPE